MSSIWSRLINLAGNITGVLPIANGGTGQSTANTALNALLPTQTGNNTKALVTDGSNTAWTAVVTNPMTTLGDIIYENVTPAPARLAGNTTATKNFLVQTGTGSVSAAPSWGTIVGADVPVVTQSLAGVVASAGQLLGINTTTVASAGNVGEYLESQTTVTNFTGATGTAITGTTLTLTAGDWDCQYFVTVYTNGATLTTLDATVWISATTGNSFTGLSVGTSQEYQAASPGSGGRIPLNSPLVRVRSDGTNFIIDGNTVAQTVLQGKVSIGNFSAGTPQYSGFLRARRVR